MLSVRPKEQNNHVIPKSNEKDLISGHTLLYLWTDSSCSWQYYPRHGYEQVGFGRVPEYSTADEEYTYRLFRKNITQ